RGVSGHLSPGISRRGGASLPRQTTGCGGEYVDCERLHRSNDRELLSLTHPRGGRSSHSLLREYQPNLQLRPLSRAVKLSFSLPERVGWGRRLVLCVLYL